MSTYGFAKALDYFLVHNGYGYDSKAIAGLHPVLDDTRLS
jgi:hypothetical protein